MRPYFNPRPPCGGRRADPIKRIADLEFQSTSSVWRTTSALPYALKADFISIHVLRVEDDQVVAWRDFGHLDFNPRPPCGGRPGRALSAMCKRGISIHVLRVEDDAGRNDGLKVRSDFNPRPPCGGRRRLSTSGSSSSIFQSTSSVWRTTRKYKHTNRFVCISIHVLRVEDDLQKS